MLTYTLFLCTCLMAAAESQHQELPFEKVRADIRATHAAYASALKKNDTETVLSLYDPDVRVLAHTFPTQIGTDVMALTLGWIQYVGDVEIDQEELGPEDPNASVLYERTNVVIKRKDGIVMADHRSLTIWKKQEDGGYLPYIVMTNYDHPTE